MTEVEHVCRLCGSTYCGEQDCLCGQNSMLQPWEYGWPGIDVWWRFFLRRTFTRMGTWFTIEYYRKRLKPKDKKED